MKGVIQAATGKGPFRPQPKRGHSVRNRKGAIQVATGNGPFRPQQKDVIQTATGKVPFGPQQERSHERCHSGRNRKRPLKVPFRPQQEEAIKGAIQAASAI